jgi:predicted ATPase
MIATLNEAAADDEILARGARGSAGWCTPELLRISGKLLLRPGKEDRARAEVLLLRSLDVARQQGALSWELRSATSLAELWERENRREAALSLLASVRDRFTEGFATADFVSSSLLLRRLRGSP